MCVFSMCIGLGVKEKFRDFSVRCRDREETASTWGCGKPISVSVCILFATFSVAGYLYVQAVSKYVFDHRELRSKTPLTSPRCLSTKGPRGVDTYTAKAPHGAVNGSTRAL